MGLWKLGSLLRDKNLGSLGWALKGPNLQGKEKKKIKSKSKKKKEKEKKLQLNDKFPFYNLSPSRPAVLMASEPLKVWEEARLILQVEIQILRVGRLVVAFAKLSLFLQDFGIGRCWVTQAG